MSRRLLSRASPAVLLVALYLIVAAATFRDYGISWDEPLQARYGEMVLRYFASGFDDRSYEHLLNLAYYGPLFEVLPPLLYRDVPQWKYEIRHACIALAAALALLGVAAIARKVSDDPRLPFFSVLILLLMPAWYGHTFINSKDIPFAALFTWSIHALLRLFHRPDRRNILLLGLVAGLTLGVRVGGLLLFGIAAAALIVQALLQPHDRRRAAAMIVPLTASAALAWIVMTIVWPWAHRAPVRNPLEALRATAGIPMSMEVLFDGRYWSPSELPRWFTAEMFAVTTPLATLTLLAVGLGVLARRALQRDLSFGHVVLIVWACAPPLLAIAMNASRYDATRHFLFLFPALALIAGTGAAAVVRAVGSRWAITGVAVALLAVLPAMVGLHPYQYAFFNQAVGGVARGADRYDSEYWATSYREAAHWIRNHRCPGKTSILVAGDRHSAPAFTHHLDEDVQVSAVIARGVSGRLPEKFDYYVGLRRQRMDGNYPATPVAGRVERMGATFTVIRGRCR